MNGQIVARRAGQGLQTLQFASFLLLLGPFVTFFLTSTPRGVVDWVPVGLWLAYVPFAGALIGLALLRRAGLQDQPGLSAYAKIQAVAMGALGTLFLVVATLVIASSIGNPGLGAVFLITTPLWITGLMLAVVAGQLVGASARATGS